MLRVIIVVGLALFVIGLTLPNVAPPTPVIGNLPLNVNYHYDIVSITQGSMADRAGLRVGDHIVPQSVTVTGRLALQSWYLLRQNESLRFTVERAGRAFPVELHESAGIPRARGIAIVKRASATIFILVAMTLVLLRPSPMMWGFFLYALGSANGSSILMEFVSPLALTIAALTLGLIYGICGPLGLLIFATRFPERPSGGSRKTIEQLIPVLALLLVPPSLALVLFVLGEPLPPQTDFLVSGIPAAITAIGIIALLAGFAELDAPRRQRLRWVVAGFGIYYALATYQTIAVYLPDQGWPPTWSNAGWTYDVLNGFVVIIPITVAYAVLKHHVLDLNFVVGRGLVYGIITSIAVATFAVIDWFLGTVLAQTKLAVAGEVVAAVAIGFWLNGLHGRVDRFVDAVIFRRRHLAERRLERVAAGLPHAQTYDSVAEMLIGEPVAALRLLSGAFLTRTADGGYRSAFAIGPPSLANARLEPGDALGVHLHGERGPVLLSHIGWTVPGATDEHAMPIVAFPVFVRYELHGIALYGAHATGEAIDPDESRVLLALSVGAAAALDHLEAADMRRRLDSAHHELAAMTQEIQTLRAATAGS